MTSPREILHLVDHPNVWHTPTDELRPLLIAAVVEADTGTRILVEDWNLSPVEALALANSIIAAVKATAGREVAS